MSEVATQNQTLYALMDDIGAYFESREMLAAQLREPTEQAEGDTLRAEVAEIDAKLATLAGELVQKTDSIAGVLRRMETEQEHLKAEQERIHERRKTLERAEKWLRDYVVSVMEKAGAKQLKTANNTLFLRSSDATVITDSAAVPAIYKTAIVKLPLWLWSQIKRTYSDFGPDDAEKDIDGIKHAEEISLSLIKKAVKEGQEVPGADVEFRKGLVLR